MVYNKLNITILHNKHGCLLYIGRVIQGNSCYIKKQLYYHNMHQEVVTSIHFVKITTKFMQNPWTRTYSILSVAIFRSAVLCSDNQAAEELSVTNCLINPFVT